MRRPILLTLALLLILPGTAAAASRGFVVSKKGGYPSLVVDGAGNLLVAYKVNTYGPVNDGLELCVVPPRKTKCAIRTHVAFPGQGYAINPAGVQILPDGTIMMLQGRSQGADYFVWAAFSHDGGRSFGPAIAIAEGFSGTTALSPDGRLGLITDGAPSANVATPRLNGADANRDKPQLDYITPFSSITAFNGGFVAASSDAGSSRAWFLPPGADGYNLASWLELPKLRSGIQPQVAGGPGGLGVMLEAHNPRGLHFRRLGLKGWSKPLSLGGPSYDNGFDLTQDPRGRLFAAWAVVPVGELHTRVYAAMSSDRGATWSSVSRLATTGQGVFGDDFYVAVGQGGRGGIVYFDDGPGSDNGGVLGPIRVVRISPSRIPTARKGHVSLRVSADTSCIHERSATARLQASLRGNRVGVGRFVRSVSFSARARRRGHVPWGARYVLNHGRTRVSAHVVPRKGKPFTLRLPMRGCL